MSWIDDLFNAIYESDKQMVQDLILNKGDNDINEKNGLGNTPLHGAVIKGDRLVIDILLKDLSIDTNVQNDAKRTPLHLAVINNQPDTVIHLLAHKAENLQDIHGRTPLDYATQLDYADQNTSFAMIESIITSFKVKVVGTDKPVDTDKPFLKSGNRLKIKNGCTIL